MPAATTRAALLETTEKEYAKLAVLCERIDPALAMDNSTDGTSIKDVIAHRAHWIGLFQGWYRDGQAGDPVFFPAEGYKWNQLKAYNAALRQQQADLGWAEARQMLADNHKGLIAFISGLSQDQLYGGPMKGARNAWTTGRWAEAAGASHYRSAAKYLRACVRTADQG